MKKKFKLLIIAGAMLFVAWHGIEIKIGDVITVFTLPLNRFF